MTATPGSYSFTIHQGATFSRVLTYKDPDGVVINLSGYSARLSIREKKSSEDAILELASGDGNLTLGGASGTITISLTDNETAALGFSGLAYYDLEIESPLGIVTRLLEGRVTLSKEVTREAAP